MYGFFEAKDNKCNWTIVAAYGRLYMLLVHNDE